MAATAEPPPVKKRPSPGKGTSRSKGRKLFIHDRKLGHRFVAGADEAGRGCLAGPLVAAAVLFDLERLTPRDVRALGKLNDSKQHTEEGRELLAQDGTVENLQAVRQELQLRAAAQDFTIWSLVRAVEALGRAASPGRRARR